MFVAVMHGCDEVSLWLCIIIVIMYCCDDVLLWWCIAVIVYCCDCVLLWLCIVVMMYCCVNVFLWWCIVVMYCCGDILLWLCIVVIVYCCGDVLLSAFSKNVGVQTSKLPCAMHYHYPHLRHLLSGNHSHFRIPANGIIWTYTKLLSIKVRLFDAFKLKPTHPILQEH